jgi:hypothetical protein
MISNYITIHAPYGEMIMSGRKDVETRLRRISDKFIGQRVGIYEPERKMFIGSVALLGQKIYPTAAEFRKDYSRHLVKHGSQYDIKKGGTKIGIIVGKPSRDIFGQQPKKYAPSTIVKNNPASSAKTSRPIIPAAAKVINWMPNTTNFDMGGGKYENLTNFLKTKGVKNFVYDQFNRSTAHNTAVLARGMTDTGSLFNVLNVIPETDEMLDALQLLKMMVNGEIYISVYEGDGSGQGKTTRDGFQHNKKLAYYLPIIQQVFPDAKKMGIIIAANYTNRNPASNSMSKIFRRMFIERYETSAGEANEFGQAVEKIKKGIEIDDLAPEEKSSFMFAIRDDISQYGALNTNISEWEEIAREPMEPKTQREYYRRDAREGRKYQAEIKKFLASLPPTPNPVPPASVARVARRGLEARKKYHRGGTAVGVARARDLSRRANVSQRTIDRMYSYFSRHRASRYENAKRISDPTSAARIADDLWGGSAGFRWAKKVRRR